MRILLIVTLVFSFAALGQTRVKENIKQKSISTSSDGHVKAIKKPKVIKKSRR